MNYQYKRIRRIGGAQLGCTKVDFDKEVEERHITSCTLDKVGTFHFIFGQELGDGFRKPYLVYYNEKEGVKHISCPLNYKVKHGAHPACVALDQNTFLFRNDSENGYELNHYLVSLDDCWQMSTYHRFEVGSKSKLLNLLNADHKPSFTEVHRTGLARIRYASEGDITMISNEGHAVKIHSSVLIGISSYFETLLKWKKMEAVPNEVRVDIPTSTLEVLVRYIYGEELDMTFVDACELVVFAQMCCLPELVHLASQWFKPNPPEDFDQAVSLWKKSFEARNSVMRAFAAGCLVEFLSPDEDGIDDSWDMDADELSHLWKDVAIATKRRYAGMRYQ